MAYHITPWRGWGGTGAGPRWWQRILLICTSRLSKTRLMVRKVHEVARTAHRSNSDANPNPYSRGVAAMCTHAQLQLLSTRGRENRLCVSLGNDTESIGTDLQRIRYMRGGKHEIRDTATRRNLRKSPPFSCLPSSADSNQRHRGSTCHRNRSFAVRTRSNLSTHLDLREEPVS